MPFCISICKFLPSFSPFSCLKVAYLPLPTTYTLAGTYLKQVPVHNSPAHYFLFPGVFFWLPDSIPPSSCLLSQLFQRLRALHSHRLLRPRDPVVSEVSATCATIHNTIFFRAIVTTALDQAQVLEQQVHAARPPTDTLLASRDLSAIRLPRVDHPLEPRAKTTTT